MIVHIEDYIIHLKEDRKIKATTINIYLRVIRAFMYYFMDRGYIDKYKIGFIKQEQTIKETYIEEALKILLKNSDLTKYIFSEYRNWVIINFLCVSGCRLRTLLNIKIEDLDFDNLLIKFKVIKSRKAQIVLMSNFLVSIL